MLSQFNKIKILIFFLRYAAILLNLFVIMSGPSHCSQVQQKHYTSLNSLYRQNDNDKHALF